MFRRTDTIELQVADLVEDEQLGLHQVLEFPVQPITIHRLGEFVSEVQSGGEVNAMAQPERVATGLWQLLNGVCSLAPEAAG